MDPASQPPRLRTRLPHVLATLYGIAIVYASLEPFHPWLAPQTPFFLFVTGQHWIRYDALLNVLAYVPFGFFVALLRRGVSPARRIAHCLVIGFAMSFAMESLQMYIPPRVASPFDLAANVVGALAAARWRQRSPTTNRRATRSTARGRGCSCRARSATSVWR